MTTESDLRRAGYPPAGKADKTVTIPLAQHEALVAAARLVAIGIEPGTDCKCDLCRVTLALRAAGIEVRDVP